VRPDSREAADVAACDRHPAIVDRDVINANPTQPIGVVEVHRLRTAHGKLNWIPTSHEPTPEHRALSVTADDRVVVCVEAHRVEVEPCVVQLALDVRGRPFQSGITERVSGLSS